MEAIAGVSSVSNQATNKWTVHELIILSYARFKCWYLFVKILDSFHSGLMVVNFNKHVYLTFLFEARAFT